MDKPLKVTIEHRWMSNTDADKCLTVGNKRIRGFTIKHYATEIACKYPDKKDPSRGVVIFNNRTYSSRTSGFQCKIRRAIPGTWKTIYINSDRFCRGDDYVSTLRRVACALGIMYEDQEKLVKEMKTARLKSTRANLWNRICFAQENVEKLAKFLKRKPKGMKRFKIDVTAVSAEATEYYFAQDERRTARWARRNEESRKRQELIDAELKLTQAERIAKWRAGERVYACMYNEPTMVRFSKGGTRVQTSRGVEILLCDALRLFKLAKAIHGKGLLEDSETLKHIEETRLAIGSYTLNKISPNGDVTVGCHFIKYEEMEQLFNQLPDEKKELEQV